jgi:hypothetical protein
MRNANVTAHRTGLIAEVVVRVSEILSIVTSRARSTTLLDIYSIVHKCLDECPYVVCIDKCRDKLESCRRSGTVCETQYDECKYICDDTYLGYEVRTNDDL